MSLRTLSVITGILFFISLGVFYFENRRGTDLVEGSDYIKSLDVGKIQKMILHSLDDSKLEFRRDGNSFVIENHKSYPASTERISELIYEIARIQVKEKKTSSVSESKLKEYGLDEEKRKYFVEVYGDEDKKLVSFSVGKSPKDKGNYIYKEGGGDVYLSQNSIRFSSSYLDFVDKFIVDIEKDDIESLSVKVGDGEPLEMEKKDKNFVLKPEITEFKKEEVEGYFSKFSRLRFDEFYKFNEDDVRGLSFDSDIKVYLKNKLIYKLSLSKKKDDHFLKVNALIQNIPNEIILNRSEAIDKEKIQEIEDITQARVRAEQFNLNKGSWVYKVSPSIFEDLVKKKKDFL